MASRRAGALVEERKREEGKILGRLRPLEREFSCKYRYYGYEYQ